jgi:hypothetical protein
MIKARKTPSSIKKTEKDVNAPFRLPFCTLALSQMQCENYQNDGAFFVTLSIDLRDGMMYN